MIFFFITFFLIYGGMHLYLFARIKSAVPFAMGTGICLGIFFVMMILAFFFIRIAERYGLEMPARFMAYTGYIWMGLIFIFVVVSLILDLYRVIVYAGGLGFQKSFSYLSPTPLFTLMFPVIVALAVNAYGYFEAMNLHTEKITIESSKIPESMGRIRIVQFSDVHIGLIVREGRLKGIVEELKKAEPDILVSTGDLLDEQVNNLAEPTMLLKSIQPRYGKFAITGNHEFYAGLQPSLDFMRNAGFSVLRSEGTTAAGHINVVGMDDPTGRGFGLSKEIAEGQLLSQFPRENFTLLLKHQPAVDIGASGLFDLQLSGHTHKGQIFPFSLITRFVFPHHAGPFNLSNQSRLYVNRGAGTWGPPIRFLAPPEITVIDLVHKK